MARPNFDVGLADPGDAIAVVEVLQEAARWIMTWRSQLWNPALLGLPFVAPRIAHGEMIVARDGGTIAGVVILLREDSHFWPDRPQGKAGYLHKLAVRRASAGAGLPDALVAHAADLVRAGDRHLLRSTARAVLQTSGLPRRGRDRRPASGSRRHARFADGTRPHI